MHVTSASLSFLLTILLLNAPAPSTAAPLAEPMVTEVSATPAGGKAQWQSYTYVPADQLAQLKESSAQMEVSVREARQALSHMTHQRDAAQQESAQLAEANEELKAQLAAARAELDEARREVAESRHAHNEELKQAQDGTAQSRRELEEVRRMLAQAQQQRDEQRREAERLKSKLDSGSEAFDLLSSLRDQLEATATEVQGLKSDVAGVRGELQAPAERNALKTRVRTLEQEQQRLNEQLASERQSLAAAVQQRDALEQSVAARDLHKRELLKTLLGLEDRLDTAEARLVQALDQQQAARAEVTELRQQAGLRRNTKQSLMQDPGRAAPVAQPAKASPPASDPMEAQVARRDHYSITIPTP